MTKQLILVAVLVAVLAAATVAEADEGYTFVTKWPSENSYDGQFAYPWGIAVDAAGNVYVADTQNHRIQKFSSTGTFLTRWGSSGSEDGQLNYPRGVAVDAAGDVYVADTNNQRIQKFSSTGTFLAKWGSQGTGDGQFAYPYGMAVDATGNLYVADVENHRIQKFSSTGAFLAKWGSSGSANGQFSRPYAVAVDSTGNVYVSDYGNQRIQKFSGTGTFLTKWGSLGSGNGQLYWPRGIAIDSSGNVYVAESGNNRIQKFSNTGSFLAKWGSGGSGDGQFVNPYGVAVDSTGNVYVVDGSNHRVQKFSGTGGFLTKWGSSSSGDGQFFDPYGIGVDAAGNVYVADTENQRVQKFTGTGTFLTKWGSPGSGNGQFATPAYGVGLDAAGNVYVADTNNYRIQKFSSTGTFLATWGTLGSGDGQFNFPSGLAVDAAGNVFVADTLNNRIQKFSSTGSFLTKWGSSGGGDGQFYYPYGVAVDAAGNVYVADSSNNRIQKFSSTGTFLGKWGSWGSEDGQFKYPYAVALDTAGNLYVADTENHRIQKFDSTGTFLTKWGTSGSADGQFRYPYAVAVDAAGNVFVAETHNDRIQVFAPSSNGADTTPPIITPTITGTAGTNGWYTSDVTVTWTIADLESEIASFVGCGTTALSADTTGTTLTCTATSAGGSSSQSVTIKVDKTPPTISGAATTSPNAQGWYSGSVTIHWTCDDVISGLAGPCPADSTITSAGANQSVSATVGDNAGNTASATVSGLNIELPPPGLQVSPSQLSFVATQGGPNPVDQPLQITNSGGLPLSWTATVSPGSGSWLTINPTSGSAAGGNSNTAMAHVGIAGLPVGIYSGTLTIAGASGTTSSPQQIPVSLQVKPAPLVPLTAQFTTDKGVYAPGETLALTGTITQGDTPVTTASVQVRLVAPDGNVQTVTLANGGVGNLYHGLLALGAATGGGTLYLTAGTPDGLTATTSLGVTITAHKLTFAGNQSFPPSLRQSDTGTVTINVWNEAYVGETTRLELTEVTGGTPVLLAVLEPTAAARTLNTYTLSFGAAGLDTGNHTLRVEITRLPAGQPGGAVTQVSGQVAVVAPQPQMRVDPLAPSLSVPAGGSANQLITVSNHGQGSSLTGIRMHLASRSGGTPYPWISLSATGLGTLGYNGSDSFSVDVNPPANTLPGAYQDTVVQIETDNGGNLRVPLTVYVDSNRHTTLVFAVSDNTGQSVTNGQVKLTPTVAPYSSQTRTTDGHGLVSFADVSVGIPFSYEVTASYHDKGTGYVTAQDETQLTVPVELAVQAVQTTWTVVPTVVQDVYDINLQVTYQVDVPVPQLAVDPALFAYTKDPANPIGPMLLNNSSATSGEMTIYNPSRITVNNVVVDASYVSGVSVSLTYSGTTGSTITIPTIPPQSSVTVHYDTSAFCPTSQLDSQITVSAEYTYYRTTPALSLSETTWTAAAQAGAGVSKSLTLGNTGYNLATNVTVDIPTRSWITLPHLLGDLGINSMAAFPIVVAPPVGTPAGTYTEDLLITAGNNTPQNHLALTVVVAVDGSFTFQGAYAPGSVPPSTGTTQTRVPVVVYSCAVPATVYLPEVRIVPSGGVEIVYQPSGILPPDITPPPPPQPTAHEVVQLNIPQKATLERQAFDATLQTTNTAGASLESFQVTIKVTDMAGSETNSAGQRYVDLFAITPPTESGYAASHAIPNGQTATSQWTLVPSAGLGGSNPDGTSYRVSAAYSYNLAGEPQSTNTSAVEIVIYPMPQLLIDYYVPREIKANHPAKLGVVVQNVGDGPAKNLTIVSGQPQITSNQSGLLITFALLGASVNGSPVPASNLTLSFGDLPAHSQTWGYWVLGTDVDGQVTGFTATYSQRDYKGATLSPLIVGVHTNIIVQGDVVPNDGLLLQVVAPGPDLDPNILLDLNTGVTTPLTTQYVTDASLGTMLAPTTTYCLTANGGWVLAVVPDPLPSLALTTVRATYPDDTAAQLYTGSNLVWRGSDPQGNKVYVVDTPRGAVGSTSCYAIAYTANPVPHITGLSPQWAQVGSPAVNLTVTGTGFVDGSVLHWNDTPLFTTVIMDSRLTATVPATSLTETGTARLTVVNPAPAGGTSNPVPFYLTTTGAAVTGYSVGTSTTPTGTVGVSLGGTGAGTPGSMTVSGTGSGTLIVAQYASNPGGNPGFASSGRFFDVYLAPGGSVGALTILDCHLNGGDRVYWYDGPSAEGWALASSQSYDPATQCVTVSVTTSTTPSLSQLTGTPFGAGTARPDLSASLRAPATGRPGQSVPVTWTVTNRGDGEAVSPWQDRVYLATDTIWDGKDPWLTTVTRTLTLPAGTSYSESREVVLPRTVGTYYLILYADVWDQVRESDETNNLPAVPIAVQAPDLTPSDFRPPAGGKPGQTVPITWTVTNQGTADALPTWQDRVYLSVDNTFGSGDILVTHVTRTLAVTPGDSYIVSTNVSVPWVTPGPYYLMLRTDMWGQVPESDETNNLHKVPFFVGAPDLTPTAFTAASGALGWQSIPLTWTVKNQGQRDAPPAWQERVYLSTDKVWDSGDTLVTTVIRDVPLPAGSSYTLNRSVVLPSVPAGSYNLLLLVDMWNQVGEMDETNNLRTVPISVGPPDLTPASLLGPGRAEVGTSVPLTWTIKNQGRSEAQPTWYDRVYLSTDDTWDNADVFLTNVTRTLSLSPGSGYTVNQSVTVPWVDAGSYYLLLRTDMWGNVSESDETNNLRAVPITVGIPDLTPTAFTAPSAAIGWQTITPTWTIKNQGHGDAPPSWQDRVYLSSDTRWDSGDTYLTTVTQGITLTGGSSYAVSQSIVVPKVAPGSYYLILRTDMWDQVSEIDETNNLWSAPISIGPPDLTPTEALTPTVTKPGQTIPLTWTVKNQGYSDVLPTWYDRVYLSTDNSWDSGDTMLVNVTRTFTLLLGSSYTTSRSVTVPKVAPGSYYLILRTDMWGNVAETDETNNERSLPITVGVPDLTPTTFTAPTMARARQPVSVSWTVKNQGPTEAPPSWEDRVYLSTDNTYDAGDTFLAKVTRSTVVEAGDSYTISISLVLWKLGTYHLILRTDMWGQLAESNETNNTDVVPITVQP